ncbi:SPARC-related modular calcium-binding protein 1-like [Sinocyclocheilus rhinocerous]|uniref:SPARC-related modular calcium-binding protein 1-like n=1 Tax=Sinocyclocheilus rhinocerous TaxID=307959 RepID=UPI0007B7E77B|nr:PREDICTED: SPARC-related modular calcium-binding protein 1-like [Sinocyclocheilus rhinocerous]
MYCHNLVLFVFLYSHALLMMCLPPASAQKSNGPRWLIGDRESPCSPACSRSHGKPVCGSDGRSYDTNCDLERAKCKDRTLTLAHRGRCKGKNWVRIDPPLPAPTLVSEVKELTEAGQTKCRTERIQALEQAKRPQESIFIPECNDDGTFAQVQCHTLTGYCWCVTTDGKPVSGSSVQNKTPVCSGNFREFMGTHAGTSGLSGSVTDKPPGPPSSGRKVSFRFFLTLNPDDGSKPTPTMETHVVPEEITAPTLWIKQLVYKENKQNSSNSRKSGYCWCVLVDTGRPIPGTSARYKKPECDSTARSRDSDMEDPFRDRDLAGCPEGKKVEFITSLLDALTTDMVQAINSPAPSGGGRFVEPDPSHTLEERVVHWYFAQLDNNGSHDINKKEMKPFKRYVKKKTKPKRCADIRFSPREVYS